MWKKSQVLHRSRLNITVTAWRNTDYPLRMLTGYCVQLSPEARQGLSTMKKSALASLFVLTKITGRIWMMSGIFQLLCLTVTRFLSNNWLIFPLNQVRPRFQGKTQKEG